MNEFLRGKDDGRDLEFLHPILRFIELPLALFQGVAFFFISDRVSPVRQPGKLEQAVLLRFLGEGEVGMGSP